MSSYFNITKNQTIYIGCMTGTSVDQYADFIAVVFDQNTQLPKATKTFQVVMPQALRENLLQLSSLEYQKISPQKYKNTEKKLTDFLISSYLTIIKKLGLENLPKSHIILSPHGQTIHHQPLAEPPICDVLLDVQYLADKTGYQVIGQHRQSVLAISMAAPLAPVLIKHLFFDPKKNTVLLNGGGIANICVLPAAQDQKLIAYDTGPANGPLDHIIQYILNTDPSIIPERLFGNIKKNGFDYMGLWAEQGECQDLLLEKLLQHEYFSRDNSRKSADRSDFGIDWILSANQLFNFSWEDILATAAELIIITIEQAILSSLEKSNATQLGLSISSSTRIIAYGGLAHNQYITSRLEQKLKIKFTPMEQLGYDPDNFEALLMAYLGFCVKSNIAIDLAYCKRANITDSEAKAIPGKVFCPSSENPNIKI